MNGHRLFSVRPLVGWVVLLFFAVNQNGKQLIAAPVVAEKSVEEQARLLEQPRNVGLQERQPEADMPRSKAPLDVPVLKPRRDAQPEIVEAVDNTFLIQNGWELIEAEKLLVGGEVITAKNVDTSDWYKAIVPGTVLSSLVDAGVYPDPYYGLNNIAIPDDLCRKSWWYRTAFPPPPDVADKQVFLVFQGINYQARVWLNGTKVGQIDGAFIRGQFEVSSLLKEENLLAVEILPPLHPGIPHEASEASPKGPNGGQLCLDGPTFICSEGWDWMPGIRDRNIGIWQGVHLKLCGKARIIDPHVITDLPLPATDRADITIKTRIDLNTAGEHRLEAQIGPAEATLPISGGVGSHSVTLSPDEFPQLSVKNPKLWWPNGYGDPHLHVLRLRLLDEAGDVVDEKTIRFGIRELSYELAVAVTPNAPVEERRAREDSQIQRVLFNPTAVFRERGAAIFDNLNRVPAGPQAKKSEVPTLQNPADIDLFKPLDGGNPHLVIRVNGRRVFCKGGNWGMDDAMKRVSRERLEPYFRLHRDANYTMIRNWTGECTEEVFYELADEYGMLVWNDFWLSTQHVNLPPADFELFLRNATDTVRRFRNHPSIALWCARNEGYAPLGLEGRLGGLVAREDGTRHYQSNSRHLNLKGSGPWHYLKEPFYYEYASGFSTEVGTHSFPTAESMATMMPKEDLWPVSDSWYYHDLHTGHKKYFERLAKEFGEPLGIEDFCKKAQVLNYNSHRAIFEAWNAKLWDDASGILLWMTHPAWPSMIWQTYTWDYETHAAFYGAKKACEPVHIQLQPVSRDVQVINTSLQEYSHAKVSAEVLSLQGKKLYAVEESLNVAANAKTNCFPLSLPETLRLPDVYCVRLQLRTQREDLLSDNVYWESSLPEKKRNFRVFNNLPAVRLVGSGTRVASPDQVKGSVSLRNPHKSVALQIKLNLRDAETGRRILPAYFSDGYFSLMPGEEKVVTFEAPHDKLPRKWGVSVEGYNVVRQNISLNELQEH
jgi:hypothetical protein